MIILLNSHIHSNNQSISLSTCSDYNIYKDNPTNSHSLATIRVVYNGRVSARDLLAFSRVQNQVAKSAMFAFAGKSKPFSNHEEPVKFVTINFHAVSDRM